MSRSPDDQPAERSRDAERGGSLPARPAGTDAMLVPAVWRVAGLLLSQTAVLTALLFYFGWVRSRETYGYFGVDVELLGFSASDYVLRSVNSAFRPLMVLGLLGVAVTVAHGRVSETGGQRMMPPIVLAVGALSVAVGLAGIAVGNLGGQLGIALPISLTAGFLLIAYADLLWCRMRGARPWAARAPAAHVRTFLLLGLAILGLFWSVSLYAVEVGRERAESLHRQLRSRTRAVVFSKDRLSLAGRGVQLVEQPPGSRYRHRYSGLYLLAQAQGRYFLLPIGWSKGRDSVLMIPDTDDIRLEFTTSSR
jgi:hypothetical protein